MHVPATRRQNSGANAAMTPMIDVIFLLLIFFVCASALQHREASLPAQLSSGSLTSNQTVTAEVPTEQAYIYLRRAGSEKTVAEMNGTVFEDLTGLETQLQALGELSKEVPVILDIGPEVPFGDLIRVYDLCQRLQFEAIKFAIKLPKEKSRPEPRT